MLAVYVRDHRVTLIQAARALGVAASQALADAIRELEAKPPWTGNGRCV
jgi:hypothetical protein